MFGSSFISKGYSSVVKSVSLFFHSNIFLFIEYLFASSVAFTKFCQPNYYI